MSNKKKEKNIIYWHSPFLFYKSEKDYTEILLSDIIIAHIKNARIHLAISYHRLSRDKICIIFLGAMALDRGSWLISYMPRCIKQNAHICHDYVMKSYVYSNESYQRFSKDMSRILEVFISLSKNISRRKKNIADTSISSSFLFQLRSRINMQQSCRKHFDPRYEWKITNTKPIINSNVSWRCAI